MTDPEEDLDAILATHGETPQPEDKRRRRNPSTGILRAWSRACQRAVQRAAWEAEADQEAGAVAQWREDRAVAEAVEEIRERWGD